jgi:hypothetical protein
LHPDPRRRSFLHAAGTIGLVALLPAGVRGAPHSPPPRGLAGRFLTTGELDTLRAVTARFIPGPPEDVDPGAVEAGVAEAIDALLGAFAGALPPIHAGGPFSDRAGGAHNNFSDFVAMDALAELGWRIRIEGSKGLPEREFAGPLVGLQDIYRNGLAHLDGRARQSHGADFVNIPAEAQDALLSDLTDAELRPFVDSAFADTLEAMYGPPEYGGNRNRVGWTYTGWAGDSQPRGYSDAQVSHPDEGALCAAPPAERAAVDQLLGVLGAKPTSPRGFWAACQDPQGS